MNQNTARKIIEIQELATRDDRYMELLKDFRCLYAPMEMLCGILSEEQRETLEEYMHLFAQLHLRMMEIACEYTDFFQDSKK